MEEVGQDIAVLKQEPRLPLSHPLSAHRQYRTQLTEGRGHGLWFSSLLLIVILALAVRRLMM